MASCDNVMSTDDFLWETAFVNDICRDRRWIIPDRDDLLVGADDEPAAVLLYSMVAVPFPSTISSNDCVIVRIMEERGRGVWDIIGGEVWEASLLLSAYLQQHFVTNRFTSYLELGCGVALPSLYLLSQSLRLSDKEFEENTLQLTMTDHDTQLLKNLYNNILSLPQINASDFSQSEQTAPTGTIYSSSQALINLAKLDWTLFQANLTFAELDELLPSVLHRNRFHCLLGSALCYAPCHQSLGYLIQYYLSGETCQEIVIIQIADREGFRELLELLTSLHISYTLDDIDEQTISIAQNISIQSNRESSLSTLQENMDSIVHFVYYQLPFAGIFCQHDISSLSSSGLNNLIKTNINAFKILRIQN
jgi:hypothetical protein